MSLKLKAGGGAIAVAALAAAVLVALHGTAAGVNEQAAAADLGAPTADVSSPPTGAFSHAAAPLYQNGKPELLFIGAQYCIHCAAQRWPVVKALDQFGTFSHLKSSADATGTFPTFNLHDATYTSAFVTLVHKDLEDRNSKPLDTLTAAERSIFNQLDPGGVIPLILVGGYALVGDGYDPTLIEGKSFRAVKQALQHDRRSDPPVTAINGEANAITAFICHADRMQPQSVCGRPGIRSIVSRLR